MKDLIYEGGHRPIYYPEDLLPGDAQMRVS